MKRDLHVGGFSFCDGFVELVPRRNFFGQTFIDFGQLLAKDADVVLQLVFIFFFDQNLSLKLVSLRTQIFYALEKLSFKNQSEFSIRKILFTFDEFIVVVL